MLMRLALAHEFIDRIVSKRFLRVMGHQSYQAYPPSWIKTGLAKAGEIFPLVCSFCNVQLRNSIFTSCLSGIGDATLADFWQIMPTNFQLLPALATFSQPLPTFANFFHSNISTKLSFLHCLLSYFCSLLLNFHSQMLLH